MGSKWNEMRLTAINAELTEMGGRMDWEKGSPRDLKYKALMQEREELWAQEDPTYKKKCSYCGQELK